MGTNRFASALISSNVNGTNTVIVNGKVISGNGSDACNEQHKLVEGCGAFTRVSIDLPSANKVLIESHPGLFGAEALISGAREGDIVMEASNGVLTIREASNTITSTYSISLRISDGTYDVLRASTAAGDIVLDGIGCVALSLESMSGDIKVRQCEFVELSAKSMSGDVEVEVIALVDTDLNVKTMSGDIAVRLSNVGNCALGTETMSGHVSHCCGRASATGGCALRGKLTTMSGDIEIR